MIRLSAFADEMSTDINGQVLFLKKNSIQHIELRFVGDKNIVYQEKKEQERISNLLKQNEITCSAIGSPVGKVYVNSEWKNHFDLFKKTVDLASFFDCQFIRIFSFYRDEDLGDSQYQDLVLKHLNTMTEYVDGTNIILIHENEKDIFGDTPERCHLLAKEINSPHFKLAYDPANFVWGQQIINPIKNCWPLMKDDVAHIHIKDWKLGAKTGSIPGEGDGQIPELLQELQNMDYDGFITLEPHLEIGGQFGGYTSGELFEDSINSIRKIALNKNINLK